jgi:hypothetical protein
MQEVELSHKFDTSDPLMDPLSAELEAKFAPNNGKAVTVGSNTRVVPVNSEGFIFSPRTAADLQKLSENLDEK